MENIINIIFVSVSLFILAAYTIANYRLKRAKKNFKDEVERAKSLIKERLLYDKKLKALGIVEHDPSLQMKTWSEIFFLLDRAAKKYQENPKQIPSPIDEALVELNYKFTILKNE